MMDGAAQAERQWKHAATQEPDAIYAPVVHWYYMAKVSRPVGVCPGRGAPRLGDKAWVDLHDTKSAVTDGEGGVHLTQRGKRIFAQESAGFIGRALN